MKKKKKWLLRGILLLAFALIACWLLFFSRTTQSAAYNEVITTQGSLTTYYNFDGVVHAKRRQTIAASAADTIKTVYVSQNQQVKEGDKLYKTEGGETIRAGIDGEVTGLYVTAGGVLAAGETTVQIIDMSDLEVRLNVDEYDVQAIVPGAPAEITVLALDRAFSGTVTSLDKNGTASGDLSYYTARVDLEEGEGVYPGMQVSAKMLRAQAENAVLLKMNAIRFDEYNKPFVYLPAGDKAEPVKTPVTVGISDGVNCEILSGVSAGQTVLVPSGMTMAEMMQMMQEMR
ncbi:MAG: HlyD family efflux transporter periplasmic adaptor subunit [Clostridia bacterium]|nr:HlyD family efflux transporter periplasmic adaptor subunit [Clostridia bacterium]